MRSLRLLLLQLQLLHGSVDRLLGLDVRHVEGAGIGRHNVPDSAEASGDLPPLVPPRVDLPLRTNHLHRATGVVPVELGVEPKRPHRHVLVSL